MNTVSQVTPDELQHELDRREDLFILDLRNEEEFLRWPMVGAGHLSTVNIPYFLFLEDEEAAIANLPSDREITLICSKGGASGYVAEILSGRGFRTRNLVGGMIAYGGLSVPRVVKTEATDGLLLIQFVRSSRGCLSYLIGSQAEAVVVDAGRDVRQYIEAADAYGLHIIGVVDTHVHADHISGGRSLSEQTGAAYYLPPADAKEVTFPYSPLTDGQMIAVGQTEVQALALATPGHTLGSTSIFVNGRYLMTGDTLFVHGMGRPDLGGMADTLVYQLHETLMVRLGGLRDEVEIFPGHYGDPSELNADGVCTTTLGNWRANNAALQVADPEAFARLVLDGMPAPPDNFRQIRQINMGKAHVDETEAREIESGPNRCAVHK